MNVIRRLDNLPADWPACAIAIGVFDGVHWGHHAILLKLLEQAARLRVEPAVLTFARHPAELLAPKRAPNYITTFDQRIELIQATGVSRIVAADFGPELAGLTHEQFANRLIRETLKARGVVVGSNFRFGKDRKGDVRYLAAAAEELGLAVEVVPAVIVGDGPVSSTRVRAVIERGDVAGASKLLGRHFELRGTVIAGRQAGRALGFPTANLRTEPKQLIPAAGVYAVEAKIDGTTYAGVCNIGRRPTFGGGPQTVEVHLDGFESDIYGKSIDVAFCRRLRDEMTFETPEHLAEQIKADLERARTSRERGGSSSC